MDILIHQNIDAHLLLVVHSVPYFFDHLVRIYDAYRYQRTVFHLLNTKDNNAAVSICERRICLPHAAGNAARCLLRFQPVALFVFT